MSLGILDKLITGPWMQSFYNRVPSRGYFGDIKIMSSVILNTLEYPSTIIVQTHDFCGNKLPIDDFVLREIMPN